MALKLAASAEFTTYQQRTAQNARVLAQHLMERGARVISGGTDTHLLLVDVTPLGVTGRDAEGLLDRVGLTVNKNAIPFDPHPPAIASGIRLGTPATTSRGFGVAEMREVAGLIVRTLQARDEPAEQSRIAGEVAALCARFPVPGLSDASDVLVQGSPRRRWTTWRLRSTLSCWPSSITQRPSLGQWASTAFYGDQNH